MIENLSKDECIKRYPIDSLQIYFAASLEIQEELIKYGFYVPGDPSGKIKMPVPIVYANFRGWLKGPEPITIERLIPPIWIGTTDVRLGWTRTLKDGKEAYFLPKEEVYVDICVSGTTIIFDLIVKGYHLERTSIRGVNPEKWNNWAMFYIDINYADDLIDMLKSYLSKNLHITLYITSIKPQQEKQQGGKEVTYYVPVSVKDFELCMGCFDVVHRYLYIKAKEHCILNPLSKICMNSDEIIKNLKLRLKYSSNVNTFAKVGVAKIVGKHPQIMIKLASTGPKKTIKGILKHMIEGKARGDLIYCNHEVKRQYIALDLIEFYRALLATKNYVDKLPKET